MQVQVKRLKYTSISVRKISETFLNNDLKDENDSCRCVKCFISLISIIFNSHGLPKKDETK